MPTRGNKFDKIGPYGIYEMTIRETRTIPTRTQELGKAAIFVAVVRGGSFAAAADALSMARSTVSQHIRSLEDRLGVRLIERTTRKLRLTDEGEVLYERMTAALAAWEDACTAFDARRSEPFGTLRVTSPGGLATTLVAPVLCQLVREFPGLDVELFADDEVRDLLGDRIDVAIRMAPLSDSRLVARLLGNDRRIFVAAPHIADELPAGVDGLSTCDWIGHSAVSARTVTLFPPGKSAAVELRPRYRAHGSTSEAQISLATGGAGIALMPALLVADWLERGALVHVYPDIGCRPLPVYAVYPARRLMPARTRVFVDRVSAAMPATDS